MSDPTIVVVPITPPEGVNLILGQAHFIKTVEDLYEALAGSSPHLRFGLAFCEASGPCLVRRAGNDRELTDLAAQHALAVGAGHSFLVLLREGFPVNVLNAVKSVPRPDRADTSVSSDAWMLPSELTRAIRSSSTCATNPSSPPFRAFGTELRARPPPAAIRHSNASRLRRASR